MMIDRSRAFECGAIIAVVMGSCCLSAQSPAVPGDDPLRFDVASIRQNLNLNPAWRMEFTSDGLRAQDVTLLWVLEEAYGLYDDDRWGGGPVWLRTRRFDINAKYDVSKFPVLTVEQKKAMLQELLADRFKLVVHHQAKEFPLYALVVTRGGPKVERTKSVENGRTPPDEAVCAVKRSRTGAIEMVGCTVSQFAEQLGDSAKGDLGRKIVDWTGLEGHYNLVLHWARQDAASDNAIVADQDFPSVFTALKEQLGLELKTIKTQLDTIVIDHAEMPSDN